MTDREMATRGITDLHQEALSRLEIEELSLLNWGAVDGAFSKEEAERIISRIPEARGRESEILDDLMSALLVVRAGSTIPRRYRTRFADTVRLLLKLRQLQRGNKPWRDGRHLVADARILHRPRQFPRRFVTADELASLLEAEGQDLPLIDLVRRLVDGRQLADFQSQATVRILRSLEADQNAGFVVSAATSGGKSLAFYLPAMAWISRNSRVGDPWVKALALYPRQELLKDQLSSAFASARLLDNEQLRQGRPIVSVGAFFGDTPYNSRVLSKSGNYFDKSWHETRSGRVCPFLRCPRCEGDMEWRKTDLAADVQRLNCRSAACGYATPDGSLRLTRDSMVNSPPDILLTTTEMLNRNLSSKPTWRLFGVKTRSPRMVLLDEIHTNEGVSGAQIALLIRRWRFLARAQPCAFVGLSATLTDPQRFFSDLTGLYESQITPIEPDPANMTTKGAEYLLALRSDPTSGVSPLSTTIQTLMLLRRMLDGPTAPSDGVMGQRVFAFTDKLDVLNRLYSDFGDAEGLDRFGRLNSQYRVKTLASLRKPNPALEDFAAREADGQIWSTAQQLGHNLLADEPLSVGRTASSDPGVDSKDVIIATASLEVGFNDPSVGAVVQHKAPRGSAAFLQRKGRAGRSESMRPYTAVVLSDFGRDRLAYLSYENLFSPELDPINLPVRNRYVLRMQATYATMDWIAHQVIRDDDREINGWSLFSERSRYSVNAQRNARTLISEVLSDGPARAHLRRHLGWSLGLDDDEVGALMWAPPRSLLLHVLPTLHRQLTSWLEDGLIDPAVVKGRPLSDFVPQAMFNELLLPEVEMHIPAATARNAPREEVLGIAQAMREFVPGKFNRRFGFTHGTESHWIPVSPTHGRAVVDLPGTVYEGEWLPNIVRDDENGAPEVVRVFRPTTMKLELTGDLNPRTNAFPRWGVKIDAENPVPLDLIPSPWVQMLIGDMKLFCHSLGGTLQICRYVSQCEGRRVKGNGQETVYSTVFRDPEGRQAALGFILDVDGLHVSLRPPDLLWIESSGVLPALLSAWLRELFGNARGIDHVNPFDRQWLLLVALGAMAKVESIDSMLAAWEVVRDDTKKDFLLSAARDIAGQPLAEDDTHLYSTVRSLLEDPAVMATLGDCIARTTRSDPGFPKFVMRRYATTMAGAFVQGMMNIVPSMTSDDVAIDPENLETGSSEMGFWISETEPGSSGIIEAFVRAYQNDPQLFWRLFERSFDPTDLELSDSRLADILDLANQDAEVRDAWNAVRQSVNENVENYRTSLSRLFELLAEHGVDVNHSVRTSVASRILAAGSSREHDELRLQLRSDWLALEARFGIEIDMRSLVCRWTERSVYDNVIGGNDLDPCERHAFFTNLMWLRGGQVRELQFEIPELFGKLDRPDRLLVPPPPRTAIHISSGRLAIDAKLLAEGEAVVWAKMDESRQLAEFLRNLAVQPTETGFLNIYPRVTSTALRSGEIHCHLELVEVAR
jgi:hypothetical protein